MQAAQVAAEVKERLYSPLLQEVGDHQLLVPSQQRMGASTPPSAPPLPSLLGATVGDVPRMAVPPAPPAPLRATDPFGNAAAP
jgi:hypothetical protein